MTDDEQREITEKLREWYGNPLPVIWEPLRNHADARQLQIECDRRGLLEEVAGELYGRAVVRHEIHAGADHVDTVAMALRATHKQITLAVWEVVNEQGKEGDS